MKKNNESYMKIELYVMSLWLLFLLIFFLTVDIPISFGENSKFIGIIPLVKRNIIAIGALLLLFYGFVLTKKYKYKWKGVVQPSVKILSIKNENYEYLTFLTTYIIPLVCIDLSSPRYIIVLTLLLIIIGYIFIKMDFYLGNPTLALMGYRLYRIVIDSEGLSDDILVVSKDKLKKDDNIEWIPIDNDTWYVRKWVK